MAADHNLEWHLGQVSDVVVVYVPHTAHRLSTGFAGAGGSSFFLFPNDTFSLPTLSFTMLTAM